MGCELIFMSSQLFFQEMAAYVCYSVGVKHRQQFVYGRDI